MESAMSDYNKRSTSDNLSGGLPGRSANSYIIPAIVVIAILAILAYAYSNDWFRSSAGTSSQTETTATPSATPKP